MIVLLLSVVQTTYAIEQVFYPTNKWLTWDSTLDYIDDLSNIQAEDNIRSTLRTSTMITPIRGNGLSFDFSSLPTT
jgi:hypothetical protein